MPWISVHQEVDGTKLRRLYRAIGCSKFEALGILNFLWFWGMKNADETGLVKDADLEVLSRYLYGCGEDCQLDMGKVVQALVDTGWIDVVADGFYIHDWDTWQEQWYKLQKNRRLDAERKRKARQMEREAAKPAPKTPEPEQMELPVEPEAKRPAKPKPDKKSYAEFVKMSEANYDRLVKLYGKAFADACIVELDNYKGARGKTYKDDYRAILCWVVDRVKEKNRACFSRAQANLRRLKKIRSESGVSRMGEFDGLLQGVVRQAQAANQPENGDYYDDEGFLVCGNCHTRRQVEVNMPDLKAVPFDPKKKVRVKMPVSCRCRAERRKQEEQMLMQDRKCGQHKR